MLKKLKEKSTVIILSLFLLLAIYSVFQVVPVSDIVYAFVGEEQKEREVASMEHGWNLVLVNDDYCIPDDFPLELMQLSNGQMIDEKIYPSLQQMFDDARATGLDLYVASGYRTEEKQQELMDDKIRTYRFQGYSRKEATELAHQWVAEPGTSEHQIGIAVDINANTSVSTSEEVYGWLEEHAHNYGFIQRYPSDKVHITGIAHEPWHYRYVGDEVAKEIYERDICLEEYIEELSRQSSVATAS